MKKMSADIKRKYYQMQSGNLLYPNEEYINSENNVNKADLVRMQHVYKDVVGDFCSESAMLDIGCNDGFFMRHFDWPFNKFIGIDMFSIKEYLHTNDIWKYTKEGKITYIKGLFEEVVLDKKFDFIFAGEIIEHVENVADFLQMVDEKLADNGILCITTPNNIGANLKEHYRQYTVKSLKETLEKFFCVIKIEELPAVNTSWPFLYAKCRKKQSL